MNQSNSEIIFCCFCQQFKDERNTKSGLTLESFSLRVQPPKNVPNHYHEIYPTKKKILKIGFGTFFGKLNGANIKTLPEINLPLTFFLVMNILIFPPRLPNSLSLISFEVFLHFWESLLTVMVAVRSAVLLAVQLSVQLAVWFAFCLAFLIAEQAFELLAVQLSG